MLTDGGLLAPYNDGRRGPTVGSYANVFGTSFSAPMVAGTAALMLGVNPQLSGADLERGLRVSARPHVVSPLIQVCSAANPGRCLCTTQTCGAGILDADQALRFALDPDAYTPPARQAESIDTAELREAAALGADRGEAPQSVATADAADTGGGALDLATLLGLAAVVGALAALRAGRGRARTAG